MSRKMQRNVRAMQSKKGIQTSITCATDAAYAASDGTRTCTTSHTDTVHIVEPESRAAHESRRNRMTPFEIVIIILLAPVSIFGALLMSLLLAVAIQTIGDKDD